jgi:hypothetical protein
VGELQPVNGNVLVFAKVRDPDSKVQLTQLLENLPGERIAANLHEVFTGDWDAGLWDEEVQRMQSIIDPEVDTLIFWQAIAGNLVRTCIAGRMV